MILKKFAPLTLFKAKFSGLYFVSAISVLFLFLGIFNRLCESPTCKVPQNKTKIPFSLPKGMMPKSYNRISAFPIVTRNYSRRKAVMIRLEQRHDLKNKPKDLSSLYNAFSPW